MNLSNRRWLATRRALRRLPWLHVASVRVLRWIFGDYEERFSAALIEELRYGDCFWDVGANLGDYTASASEKVGALGSVIAIEPSPACAHELRAVAASAGNVHVVEAALSDFDGEASFSIADGDYAVSNRLTDASSTGEASLVARVTTGDSLARGGVRLPNVIKIDVEGYELEVLRGMRSTLMSEAVRAVFLEVHFGQLDARGMPDASALAMSALQSAGFSIRWVDASHAVARR